MVQQLYEKHECQSVWGSTANFSLLLSAFAFLLCVASLTPAAAQTPPPGLTNPAIVGQARLSFLGFAAYDAILFTENAAPYTPGKPVALELTYRRQFTAKQLTDATATELKRLFGASADMMAAAQRLGTCFRSVNAGNRFTAVSRNANDLQLYLNGTRTCQLGDPQIAQRFLAIWLSDQSRYPSLSRQLRGQ